MKVVFVVDQRRDLDATRRVFLEWAPGLEHPDVHWLVMCEQRWQPEAAMQYADRLKYAGMEDETVVLIGAGVAGVFLHHGRPLEWMRNKPWCYIPTPLVGQAQWYLFSAVHEVAVRMALNEIALVASRGPDAGGRA